MHAQHSQLFDKKKRSIYIVGLLTGMAIGIVTPLSTAHMAKLHTNEVWIGIIASAFYVFMAVGSIYVHRKLKNRQMKSMMMIGLLSTAICCMLFPFGSSPVLWLFFMASMGLGMSMNLIGVQSSLQRLTDLRTRGLANGVYSLFFSIGLAVTSVLGPIVYEKLYWLSFFSGSLILMGAANFIQISWRGNQTVSETSSNKFKQKLGLPLFGAFAYGFSETTVISLYPLFLLTQGFPVSIIGYGLGMFVVGGLIGAVPIAFFADRVGKEKMLSLSILIAIFSVLGIVLSNSFSLILLFSFISGGLVGPVFPVTLALTVENLHEEEIASGTALFTFANGFGSAVGPFLSSTVMTVFGTAYLFLPCLILFGIFMFSLTYKELRDKKIQKATM